MNLVDKPIFAFVHADGKCVWYNGMIASFELLQICHLAN
jgi:hypothetical protein